MASIFKKLAKGPLSAIKKTFGYQSGEDLREQRRYQAGREDTAIQRTVADARAAGIHPLFALGGAIGGQSSQVQPQTGSQVGEALRYIQRSSQARKGRGQSSLVDDSLIKQATANTRLSNARADSVEWELQNSINKRAEGASNSTQDIEIPAIVDAAQEIKKGEVDPYRKKTPEQNLTVMSPITDVRMGKQIIKVPIQDMESAIEDPVTVAIATYFYKGNENVDWGQAGNAYFGMKKMPQWKKRVLQALVKLIRTKKKFVKQQYTIPKVPVGPANFGAQP